jgi:hypothetical protein
MTDKTGAPKMKFDLGPAQRVVPGPPPPNLALQKRRQPKLHPTPPPGSDRPTPPSPGVAVSAEPDDRARQEIEKLYAQARDFPVRDLDDLLIRLRNVRDAQKHPTLRALAERAIDAAEKRLQGKPVPPSAGPNRQKNGSSAPPPRKSDRPAPDAQIIPPAPRVPRPSPPPPPPRPKATASPVPPPPPSETAGRRAISPPPPAPSPPRAPDAAAVQVPDKPSDPLTYDVIHDFVLTRPQKDTLIWEFARLMFELPSMANGRGIEWVQGAPSDLMEPFYLVLRKCYQEVQHKDPKAREHLRNILDVVNARLTSAREAQLRGEFEERQSRERAEMQEELQKLRRELEEQRLSADMPTQHFPAPAPPPLPQPALIVQPAFDRPRGMGFYTRALVTTWYGGLTLIFLIFLAGLGIAAAYYGHIPF